MKTRFNYIIFIILFYSSCKKEEVVYPPSLPTLNTLKVSSIKDSSAVCGGEIISDGKTKIEKKGVCYSTKPNPTLSDNIIASQDNLDAVNFTVTIPNLKTNTRYYIRSYATNSQGTAYGNNEEFFTTLVSLPILVTTNVSAITSTSAICKGNITYKGGDEIPTIGICYSTSSQPSILDSIALSTSVTDSFSVNLFRLEPNTTYFARVFATNSGGTSYGSEISFTTLIQLFAFGNSYQGGIIFYIDDSGNHGLVVAANDQSTSADWGCDGTNISGAEGSTINAGEQNTIDIMNGCISSSIAASYCSNLVFEGYSDWSLPSIDELALIYQNLHSVGLGNFSSYNYWSSTEYDNSKSWNYNFGSNIKNTSSKASPYSVRAIRAF